MEPLCRYPPSQELSYPAKLHPDFQEGFFTRLWNPTALPKMSNGIEVKAICRPVKAFHTLKMHGSYLYAHGNTGVGSTRIKYQIPFTLSDDLLL